MVINLRGFDKSGCEESQCPDFDRCNLLVRENQSDLCAMSPVFGRVNPGTVDVIIPTFNCGLYIKAAVESVLAQDYEGVITITVVDDGSTDDTSVVLGDLMSKHDVRITYVRLAHNVGPNAARNEALRLTKGEFVFMMDADSVLEKTAIRKLVSKLAEDPTSDYAYSYFIRVYEDEDRHTKHVDQWRPPEFSLVALLTQNYISMMSLVRRRALPSTGLDQDITRFQDWDLWLTLADQDSFGVLVDEFLFTAFVRPEGISSTAPTKKQLIDVRSKHGLV